VLEGRVRPVPGCRGVEDQGSRTAVERRSRSAHTGLESVDEVCLVWIRLIQAGFTWRRGWRAVPSGAERCPWSRVGGVQVPFEGVKALESSESAQTCGPSRRGVTLARAGQRVKRVRGAGGESFRGEESQERIDRGSGATLGRANGLAGGTRLRSRRSQTQAVAKAARARGDRETSKVLA
jgi:hypothetical protein